MIIIFEHWQLFLENYMSDFEDAVVSGEYFDEFSKSLTKATQSLPPELSKRLRAIGREYFARNGFREMYNRMNGRTVRQIFAEYQQVVVEPIASGNLDDVEYRLYERPQTARSDDGNTDDQSAK